MYIYSNTDVNHCYDLTLIFTSWEKAGLLKRQRKIFYIENLTIYFHNFKTVAGGNSLI